MGLHMILSRIDTIIYELSLRFQNSVLADNYFCFVVLRRYVEDFRLFYTNVRENNT